MGIGIGIGIGLDVKRAGICQQNKPGRINPDSGFGIAKPVDAFRVSN